ncbi:hypothetical protein [Salininema proteolyticum]|uniref:Uncharacterized protein n=1 Tax=Salininema proteolyticum TaxID=1607685 RepID=A0ABV8U4H5_9ACTN
MRNARRRSDGFVDGPFGHRPVDQRDADLEAEVEMERGGIVALDDELFAVPARS